MMTEISYSGYRFPPEIIQQAIWLWWLFAYFVVITIGMLYLSPIGVSLVRKSCRRAWSR
jgi:dipeptide/tripeptide permease